MTNTPLYDRDILELFVREDKLHVVYYAPTIEAMFTKEDLEYMIGLLEDKE